LKTSASLWNEYSKQSTVALLLAAGTEREVPAKVSTSCHEDCVKPFNEWKTASVRSAITTGNHSTNSETCRTT